MEHPLDGPGMYCMDPIMFLKHKQRSWQLGPRKIWLLSGFDLTRTQYTNTRLDRTPKAARSTGRRTVWPGISAAPGSKSPRRFGQSGSGHSWRIIRTEVAGSVRQPSKKVAAENQVHGK